jgi:hypothetical protein
MMGRASSPTGEHGAPGCSAIALLWYGGGSQHAEHEHRSGRPGPGGPARSGPAADGNAEASPPASPEQIYHDVMARLAVITDQWQQARDALLRG